MLKMYDPLKWWIENGWISTSGKITAETKLNA